MVVLGPVLASFSKFKRCIGILFSIERFIQRFLRFLSAAQNDSLHCNDSYFSQAVFDSLRKEYSRNCLAEIRQELQSLYTSEEIELVMRLLRGGSRIIAIDQ